jgi:hypothetical protein
MIIKPIYYGLEQMKRIPVLLLLALLPCMAFPGITEEGVGILFGEGHAFSVQAPPGWVLDNESGVKHGLHAVFYHVGQTWKDARVIAYARGGTKSDEMPDIPSLVQFNVDRFQKNGSPNYKAEFTKTIETSDGKRKVQIYFFEGDAWGNYEAAGYIEEKKTINFVVLSCKSKELFEAALPSFESLVASYLFISDEVEIRKNEN